MSHHNDRESINKAVHQGVGSDQPDSEMEFVNRIIQGDPKDADGPEDKPVNQILKGENQGSGISDEVAAEQESVIARETGALNIPMPGDAVSPPEAIKDIVAEIIVGESRTPDRDASVAMPENDAEIDPEFLNDFLVETKEHIENIEMDVLALETDPANMELIHGLFREFHTIKGLAGFVNQNVIREIAHQTETKMDDCRKEKTQVNKAIIDLILASSDYIKMICDDLSLNRDQEFLNSVAVQLEALKHKTVQTPEERLETSGDQDTQSKPNAKIGEILMQQGINKETISELLDKQGDYPGLKLGQVAVKEKKAEAKDIIQSLRAQEQTVRSTDSGYARVSTLKVDNMVDLTGELVIIQSQIEREIVKRFSSNDILVTQLLRAQKLSKDIQNISMSLRMVSLKSTFQKAYRIARDAIAELGKNVNLEIYGEETAIDRAVTDRLLDPLLHLVKNAISHGIEPEQERIARGKPVQGQVKIKAYSKRGNVYIEISDDGQGINPDKIYRKAVEKQLLDPSKTYTDDEIINLIFLPGFSTSDRVNNISGRGVGLDVVKTEISRIGGKVEIENQLGEGCSFILKIPINLAAINGTIVDIGGARYIIPTLYIKRILKPDDDQWVSITGNKAMIRIRDEIIPVIPIARIFELTDAESFNDFGLMIIVELEQKLKALPVRQVVDRREVVVKPLGSEFRNLNYVSGASILGDGLVSLILDIENLFKMEESK
jgi:two-component system chemotaxis sensor kinase CheA